MMRSIRGVCVILLASTTFGHEAYRKDGRLSYTHSRRLGGQQEDVCYADDSGNGKFKDECGFPFTYKGTKYNKCTTADNGGKPWCFHENGKDWGECEDSSACKGSTPPPTPNPTKRPSAAPSSLPPTESPTVAPTPGLAVVSPPPSSAPIEPPTPPGDLVTLQITPIVLGLLIPLDDRRFLQEKSTSDVLYDVVYEHLLEFFDSSLAEPVAALQLLLLSQGQAPVNQTAVLVNEKVLGSVYFYEQTPAQADLDATTALALVGDEFLAKVQNSTDPTLSNTMAVVVTVDNSANPFDSGNGDDVSSGESKGGVAGMSTTAFIALCATIVCGICAVGLLAFLVLRLRKQKHANKEKEASSSDKNDSFPKTSDTDGDHNVFENKDVEVDAEGAVSDLESVQSTYSYTPDDSSTVLGGMSLANYTYNEPEESAPPKSPAEKPKELPKPPQNLLSPSQIESELDDILDARGLSLTMSKPVASPRSNSRKKVLSGDASESPSKVVSPQRSESPARQLTLSEQSRKKDDRDWTEKYGIPPSETVL